MAEIESKLNLKLNIDASKGKTDIKELNDFLEDTGVIIDKVVKKSANFDTISQAIGKVSNAFNKTREAYERYQAALVSGNAKEKANAESKWKSLKTRYENEFKLSQKYRDLQEKNEKESFSRMQQYRREKEGRDRVANIAMQYRSKGLGSMALGAYKEFISPTGIINKKFDTAISENKEKIEFNEGKIKKYNEDLLKMEQAGVSKDDVSYQEVLKKRDTLQGENKQMQSKNIKMAVAQAAVNSVINGIKKFGKIANDVFRVMGFDLKNIMKDVINKIAENLKETGIASYDIGSSLFTNASARETEFKYGLSGESAYALTKTMEMLNMKSDEDLMYMNENQKEAFNSIMDKYKTWYSNLESTGALLKLQEAQLEFKMFKEELSMKFLTWFAEHKDTILTLIEGTMTVLTWIADAVGAILDLIPGSSSSSISAATASDTAQVNNTSRTSNINVNVNNTNNATANLNSKAELDSSLNSANADLVKQIASNLTSQ